MLYKISNKVYYTKHRYMYLEPAIGYIKGDSYSIMIDTGNSKEQVKNFFTLLKEQDLPLPSYAILTHSHWDHSFGATYTNVPLITSFKTNEYLKQMSSWVWNEASLATRVANNLDTRYSAEVLKKVYPNLADIQIKTADLTKLAEFSLNLGGVIVHAIPSDNSHSDDALLIYVKDEKILFLGDSHCKNYEIRPVRFYKEKLRTYIDTIEKIDFEVAVPGHGNTMTKKELIQTLEEEYTMCL